MPSPLLPPSRPQITAAEVDAILAAHGVDRKKWPLLILGIRGYFLRTMGAPGGNDRGLYDDALVVVGPSGIRAFNGNTDPSRARPGHGTGAAKGMATLKPGFWPCWCLGLHRGQYLALVQRKGPVTVLRDKEGGGTYEDTGYFGINGHAGGEYGTSSEGCQTVPRDGGQWAEFITLVETEARGIRADWRALVIPYLLIENRA